MDNQLLKRIYKRNQAWALTLPLIWLEMEDFDALLEYSTSFPTGVTIGKTWKCQHQVGVDSFVWLLAAYVPGESADTVNVEWYRIAVDGRECHCFNDEIDCQLHPAEQILTVGIFAKPWIRRMMDDRTIEYELLPSGRRWPYARFLIPNAVDRNRMEVLYENHLALMELENEETS